MILVFFTGGALTLFAARASAMQAKGVFGVVSRESALVANNILLAVSAFVVFVGTMWPLVAEMFFDRKLSVGPPFFDMAFTPFMIVLGLILPIGAMMAWKRGKVGRTARTLVPAFVLAIALAGLVWAMQTGRSMIGPDRRLPRRLAGRRGADGSLERPGKTRLGPAPLPPAARGLGQDRSRMPASGSPCSGSRG